VALVTSPEPGAWSLKVRGDLLLWGKVGAQKVPFEEFLRTRLETYGDVLRINETPCRSKEEPREHEASIVVMPSEAEKRRARAKATGASRTRSPHS
jgi:hypothetical protein